MGFCHNNNDENNVQEDSVITFKNCTVQEKQDSKLYVACDCNCTTKFLNRGSHLKDKTVGNLAFVKSPIRDVFCIFLMSIIEQA